MTATRFEAGVFGSLATAGVAAILLALGPYSQFVSAREAVVAALEGRPHPASPSPVYLSPLAPTNITCIKPKAVATAGPNKV